ncbi:uncharacterized protein LOC135265892 [Tribolium castaneum]|uniref:uncharacterized protein LOC135265892 n=1 Tax=Tribolium castaneum TaxID=7070 RepID=UPI0030FEDC37
MDSGEEDDFVGLEGTPPKIQEAAAAATANLMPQKSKKQYEKQYKLFINWRQEKQTESFSKNVLLAYIQQLSTRMKPSSLWAIYSMLRTTLNLKNNIDISKYPKLCKFLKNKSSGYNPKKSRILTPEQIKEFLCSAPDENYLFSKVGLIFGIMGACRREELMKLETNHVEDLSTALLVHIPDTKTKTERQFVIGGNFYGICKKYMELRPQDVHTTRFFLNYQRGKCTRQPVGINKFGSLPCQVATFLKLPNPTSYTGHCLRRSSATLLVDAGADITALKRHGGWRSTTVAETYIDHSLNNKIQTANKISNIIQSESSNITQSESSNIIHSESSNIIQSESFDIENTVDKNINLEFSSNTHDKTRINYNNTPLIQFNNCNNISSLTVALHNK